MRVIDVATANSDILAAMEIRPPETSAGLGAPRGAAETAAGSTRTTPRRLLRRSARAVGYALAGLAAAFGLGFVVFAVTVSLTEIPADPRADAIIALTGGRDRVAEAVDLLAEGRGRRLLISGVHPRTSAADIRKLTEGDRTVFACCVDLGRTALSTAGNATEAAEWVKEHGFTSLIVVTSAYHMPRSLLELDRALPSVRKVPYPVSRPDLNLETWYRHPTTAKLLFGEYLKYIVARFAHQAPQITATRVARVGGDAAR